MDGHSGGADAVSSELVRDGDILGLYLREISRYPLLSAEQEVDIGRRIRSASRSIDCILVSTHFGKDAFRSIESDVKSGVRDIRSYVKPADSDSPVPKSLRVEEYGDFIGRVVAASSFDEGVAAWDAFRWSSFSQSELEYIRDGFYEHVAGCDGCSGIRDVLESFRSESKAASELLFNSNLRLVVSIAKKYGIGTLLDRIQDGNAGLMSAVVRYNPELGFRFSTYATWWIRQSIERELSDKGHFAHFGAQFYYIMRKVNGFLDRNPDKWDDLEAIYSATGVTGEDVAVALRARGLLNPDSLDRKLYDGDDAIDLKSVIPDTSIPDPESVCIYGSSRRNMEQFISLLKKPLDREIITFYYYDGLSFSDIGQKVGLRTEAVKQRHGIALRLLRRIIESR